MAQGLLLGSTENIGREEDANEQNGMNGDRRPDQCNRADLKAKDN